MTTAVVCTQHGLRAWISRNWELLNVTLTLHWAEQDREQLAAQLAKVPRRLRQMDRDLEELRVRQALLRMPTKG